MSAKTHTTRLNSYTFKLFFECRCFTHNNMNVFVLSDYIDDSLQLDIERSLNGTIVKRMFKLDSDCCVAAVIILDVIVSKHTLMYRTSKPSKLLTFRSVPT